MIRCEYDAEDRPIDEDSIAGHLTGPTATRTEYENRYAFLYPLYNIFFELRVVK